MNIVPELINLDHIRQFDAGQWGSKASALGELRARGFPVPDGFCLSIAAFRQSGTDSELSPPLGEALRAAAERLLSTHSFLAVRSSATAEDLPGTSFAGLYQSVIGVSEPERIGAAVQTVWRSYGSPVAAGRRASAAHSPDETADGMGVLIQAVIEAEVAGVCFSVDPVQPRSGRLVINTCWGLGSGVVDGAIPADTLWLRREDLGVVERRIVEKDICFALDAQGGMVRRPVAEAQRRSECLPEDWAHRVAQFALAAEQALGRPQDVEWAIANGQVWILQSRAIASLDLDEAQKRYYFPVDWANPADAGRLWTRWRFERHGDLPFLPLDIDYIYMHESTRLTTCLFMGADRNQDLQVVHGQIYISPAPMPLSSADLRIRLQAFLDLEQRLMREGRTAWDHWGAEIEQANQRLMAVETGQLDGPGLAAFLEEAMAAKKRHTMLHPMIGFKPRQPFFDAFRAVSGLFGAEAETAAYRLLEGEETPLTRMIDGLYGLAAEARGLPAVADWVWREANDPNQRQGGELVGYPMAAQGAADWFSRLQDFLAEFGDRNGDGYGSEALLSTLTWRDEPMQVVQLAAQFLDAKVEATRQQRERARRAVDAEVEAMCARCPDAQAVADFKWKLEYYRRVQAVIEIHNHHIEQIGLGQIHRAVMAAARWLQSSAVLLDVENIFWLTFAEIVDALVKPERELLVEVTHRRQAEYAGWAEYQPPPYLGLPPPGLSPRPAGGDAVTPGEPQASGQIRGIGASAGVAIGRARVISTWLPAPQILPGDILVAENAGPLWIPFFPVLAGIVLESGSLGQHAASTAREYGLPAVISTPKATQLIKDGDWITIDGTRGMVELVSHP